MHPIFALMVWIAAAAYLRGREHGKGWLYAALSLPITVTLYYGAMILVAQQSA